MKRSPLKAIIGVVLLIIFLAATGTDMFLIGQMLSPCWAVVMVAVILSATISAVIYRSVSLRIAKRRWLILPASMLFLVPVLLAAILLVDRTRIRNEEHCTAVAERVFTKTRYRSERVGRRSYKRGAPYKVYYMTLRLEDGLTKEIGITAENYRHVHREDSVGIIVREGLFGLRHIDTRNIAFPERRTRKNKIHKTRPEVFAPSHDGRVSKHGNSDNNDDDGQNR